MDEKARLPRMAKIGDEPKLRFEADGDRYVVMLGDDRAGFVRQKIGGGWNAADTFMDKSRDFPTRRAAGDWLKKELERAIKRGTL